MNAYVGSNPTPSTSGALQAVEKCRELAAKRLLLAALPIACDRAWSSSEVASNLKRPADTNPKAATELVPCRGQARYGVGWMTRNLASCVRPDGLGEMWRFSTIKARPGNMNSASVHRVSAREIRGTGAGDINFASSRYLSIGDTIVH